MKEKLLASPVRIIAFSFFMVILVGSLLLWLPIANAKENCGYLNHLFIATSATCVTGLVSVVPYEQYTLFGQIVIICLIQVGGLGFLTFLTMFFSYAKKRLSLSNRLLMQESLNMNSLSGITPFVRKIFIYTFGCELLGAVILAFQFVPEFGVATGLYYAIFHSISAFCNAGFDVIGSTSLIAYNNNYVVCLTICFLIIAGGIGFAVAFEIKDRVRYFLTHPGGMRNFLASFTLHAKLAILVTGILLVSGTFLVYLFEKDNPGTLGGMLLPQQILNAFFQSTTYRTAGFASIDQGALNDISKLLGCLIMFIGGSPAGTAGGIKTVTLATIVLAVRAVVKGNRQIGAFGRKIKVDTVLRALAVFSISIGIVMGASVLLCVLESYPMIDLFYEAFSAFATVGLSANLTSQLCDLSKLILILLMYVGRIGPITMVLSFMKKSRNNRENQVVYPDAEILVG